MDASHAPEVVPAQEAPQVYYTTKEQEQLPPALRLAKSKKKKKIMDMRPTTFWLLLVLVFVIIAVAVGGGVGGSMAVKNAKKSPSEPSNPSGTPTSTSSTSSSSSSSSSAALSGAYVAPTDVILPLPCSDATPAVTVAGSVYRFNATCGVDHPKNDLLPIVAYSLHDCLAACAKYNSKWGGGCKGVVFGADLAKFVAVASGNCYLKNGTSEDAKTDGVISAVLMGSVSLRQKRNGEATVYYDVNSHDYRH
ncbi:hypothetical protein LMH87_004974 [Akanthomyces muscarius]|uniref:Apple domain-containing protein n=1 Tax=Akanthomyces muscarius TaxID=2231603 RepID=A0A9W8QJT2_AKAMU|nr:hypothetical protein LMH87_004974 [Akanthomyces muscarius]KAJ4163233.1 hypothetical protein LMH87_004974 [Akanthomyces muscarius]